MANVSVKKIFEAQKNQKFSILNNRNTMCLKIKLKTNKKCEDFLDFLKVEKRKLGMKVVKFRFLELKISGKDAANLKLQIPL